MAKMVQNGRKWYKNDQKGPKTENRSNAEFEYQSSKRNGPEKTAFGKETSLENKSDMGVFRPIFLIFALFSIMIN